ncbi:MAG: hypothetical protein ACLFQV_01755 [Vulcanimicrobiota bacterium]
MDKELRNVNQEHLKIWNHHKENKHKFTENLHFALACMLVFIATAYFYRELIASLSLQKIPWQSPEFFFTLATLIVFLVFLIITVYHYSKMKKIETELEKIDSETMLFLKQLNTLIKSGSPDKDENCIELFFPHNHGGMRQAYVSWKGLFKEERVILSDFPSERIHIYRKKGFKIVDTDEKKDFGCVCEIKMGKIKKEGVITLDNVEKYKKWKNNGV